MIFGNPVPGEIHRKSWRRPKDNTDFRVSQKFGCTMFERERPLGDCEHFHRAIDLSNLDAGANVLAANGGKVHFAGKLGDGNIVVELDHGDGWFTIYGHLRRKTVAAGDPINRGKKIGEVGSTGNTTGPHLHFGVKSRAKRTLSILGDSNGRWEDPWPLLQQNVKVRPRALEDPINIRAAASLEAAIFAKAKAGRIIRFADKVDLGPTTTQRPWGGAVTGGKYELEGKAGNTWDKIFLDGAFRFIAEPLAERSAS